MVKITVTLECRHPDGYSNHEDNVGTRLIVNSARVLLDGRVVVQRDRRMIKNREAGHPWVCPNGDAWTGFTVRVES